VITSQRCQNKKSVGTITLSPLNNSARVYLASMELKSKQPGMKKADARINTRN
jgi:hypothetical protein